MMRESLSPQVKKISRRRRNHQTGIYSGKEKLEDRKKNKEMAQDE
jgi:hypothetical protein